MSGSGTLRGASLPWSVRRALKVRRELLGLKQSEVAEMAGLHQTSVSHYELGKYDPQIDSLLRWVEALGLELTWSLSTRLSDEESESDENGFGDNE